jgi:hypothetical protein
MRYEPREPSQTVADVPPMPSMDVVNELTSIEKQSYGR